MFIVNLLRKNSNSSSASPKKTDPQMTQDLAALKSGYTINSKIGDSNFCVYTISTNTNNKCFAMKEFPYVNCEPNICYQNEARFSQFKHPNIVNMVSTNSKQERPLTEGVVGLSSNIIMEYAPHGDFGHLINNYGSLFDEKLARTYFRQLIKGLKYLHKNQASHLDIKPENLLLGADFNLKITDFDVSYVVGDKKIISSGSMSYRCPEINKTDSRSIHLRDPYAADVYSAGIILFILKTGVNPYFEDRTAEEVNYQHLMNNNNNEFWRKHAEDLGKSDRCFSDSFIDLFNGMTKQNPIQRYSIKQIKRSKWYNGPVYSGAKLERKMKEILSSRPSAQMC